MGKPIFKVEISNGSPKGYETATVMEMPATWAEFNDALQKARIKDGRSCKNELTCIRCEALRRGTVGDNINLYDLNLFAQRLATLTEEQRPGMEALLKMEQEQHSGPIPLERLINLTYNTDVCCFAPRVTNHEELGTFLYGNEMLSDEAMALLGTTDEGAAFGKGCWSCWGNSIKRTMAACSPTAAMRSWVEKSSLSMCTSPAKLPTSTAPALGCAGGPQRLFQ